MKKPKKQHNMHDNMHPNYKQPICEHVKNVLNTRIHYRIGEKWA